MAVSKNSPKSDEISHERNDPFDSVTMFLAVVAAGGFASAAQRMGLTRSAVSKAIARLEARLSTRLFHRNTRSQSLTEDGLIYHEHCLQALAQLQLAQTQMEAGRTTMAGRLSVTMPVMFGRHYIAPVLLALAQEQPELELHMSFNDRHVDVLTEGFDLAIRVGELGVESEGLRARKLLQLHKRVCAAPSYLAAHGTPKTLADLSAHNIVHYRHAERIHTWKLTNEHGQLVKVPLSSRLQFNDLEVVADAAVAGMGLAWLPEWLVRERLASGALVSVLENAPSAVLTCYALWPSSPHMPLRVRLAVDALLEQLPLI